MCTSSDERANVPLRCDQPGAIGARVAAPSRTLVMNVSFVAKRRQPVPARSAPPGSGMKTHALIARPRTSAVPVPFVSSHGQTDTAARAGSIGSDDGVTDSDIVPKWCCEVDGATDVSAEASQPEGSEPSKVQLVWMH